MEDDVTIEDRVKRDEEARRKFQELQDEATKRGRPPEVSDRINAALDRLRANAMSDEEIEELLR